MWGWLLGKIGLGGVEKAVEGVAGIVTQHMRDNEAADELKAKLKANADTVYAGIRKAMAGSAQLVRRRRDRPGALGGGVRAGALSDPALRAGHLRLGRAYIATGELEDYPVGHHELISLVALTGGYGGLHLAGGPSCSGGSDATQTADCGFDIRTMEIGIVALSGSRPGGGGRPSVAGCSRSRNAEGFRGEPYGHARQP